MSSRASRHGHAGDEGPRTTHESDQAVLVDKAEVAFCRARENDLKGRNDENTLLLAQFNRNTHSPLARSFAQTVPLREIGYMPQCKRSWIWTRAQVCSPCRSAAALQVIEWLKVILGEANIYWYGLVNPDRLMRARLSATFVCLFFQPSPRYKRPPYS